MRAVRRVQVVWAIGAVATAVWGCETAVIAGLTVTEVQVEKTGIPFLVDLPILGKLFGFSSQTENRRDLIILITPHIIDDLATPTPGTGNN